MQNFTSIVYLAENLQEMTQVDIVRDKRNKKRREKYKERKSNYGLYLFLIFKDTRAQI